MNWEELREEEFHVAVKESKGVCVIPIGCLEMHGQHLPAGTDNYEGRLQRFTSYIKNPMN